LSGRDFVVLEERSSPHQFWDSFIFCRRTNGLEFTAWSSACAIQL